MANAVVTKDMKESSAILALPRTMSRIEIKRNCSALHVMLLVKDPVLRPALKVCNV
jgi:hypothetical protein